MSEHPAGEHREPDPAVVALARDVQRASHRIDRLGQNLAELVAEVAALHGTPAPPTVGAEPVPVRSWLAVDDQDQAVKDLGELVGWVDDVYVRFSRAQLSSCWMWHPDVVEELWCLRGAHLEAFHPELGSWMRVGDWLDRQRPGVERRLNPLMAKCALSRHVDRPGRPADVGEPPPPPLAGHHAVVAAWWAATHTAGPDPTPQHLAEATEAEYPGAVHRR